MLAPKHSIRKRWIMLLDVILTIISFILAYYTRTFDIFHKHGKLYDFEQYTWLLWVIIPTWPIILKQFGLYNGVIHGGIKKLIGALIKTVIVGSLILASAIFITKHALFSRLFVGFFIVYNFTFLLVEKLTLRHLYMKKRDKVRGSRLALVSTDEGVVKFLRLMELEEDIRVSIAGYFSIDNGRDTIEGIQCLGPIDWLGNYIKNQPIDEVIFILPKDYISEIEPYIADCEEMGITVHMLLDLYNLKISKTKVSYLGHIPLLTFYTVTLDEGALLLKRILDIIGAIVGLIITGILFVIFAPIIKKESPGPVFYSQPRVGKNGRVFKLYKFRSMYQDADERKKELEHLNMMKGAIFKIEDDPRITKIGKFMRKYSLDEFPQFYNVLKGDMSLVGTRPPTLEEVEHYENWHRRRLSIKPGITGMWQVSGRNEIEDFDEIVALDVKYIDNWSIALDLKIIFKTIGAVFNKTGM